MHAIFFNEDDKGINPTDGEIPADLADEAEMYRRELVEAAAEQNDELMMKFIEDEELTLDEIKDAIRKACIANAITPVVCGASFKNKGVQPLLDAVVDYLPSPLDIPAIKGIDTDTDETVERPADPKAPFAALAFKVMTDPFVGRLTYFRVYSGTPELRLLRPELDEGPQRAHRSPAPDARQPPRGHRRGLGRRHRRGCRPEEHHHRRHAVRRRSSRVARVHGLPGPGHRHRDRAQDQGRAGQAG